MAISITSPRDIFPGSAGTLLPGVEARIISLLDGSEITEYGKPGELLLKSPSVTNLGYLNDDKATSETFGAGEDAWLRTGDEAMFLRNPERDGHEHLFIVDRIKELIKVNVSFLTISFFQLTCSNLSQLFRATKSLLLNLRLAYWIIR